MRGAAKMHTPHTLTHNTHMCVSPALPHTPINRSDGKAAKAEAATEESYEVCVCCA